MFYILNYLYYFPDFGVTSILQEVSYKVRSPNGVLGRHIAKLDSAGKVLLFTLRDVRTPTLPDQFPFDIDRVVMLRKEYT